jgi:hypothetical protein
MSVRLALQSEPSELRDGPISTEELDRRISAASPARARELLAEAKEAVRDDMSSSLALVDDLARAEAEHRKWQAIHRYIQAVPFRDREGQVRSGQWQQAMAVVRPLGDFDLIEWVHLKIDTSLRLEQSRRGTAAVQRAGPTYLVLLNTVASRKRRARAALSWAQEAKDRGWITCTSETLGENLKALHQASIHARDNPDYGGHADGAYRRGE